VNAMHKAPIAEWLLTHVSTSQRASEVVGDLLEQKTSFIQFWLTIARIWVALTWRWILGALLAALSGLIVLAPYSLFVKPRWNLTHPHSEPWMLFAYLPAAALCFGTNTGLAVSRYGFRDRLTWMSAAIWVILIACACCGWMPYAPYVVTLLLTAGLSALLLFSATRRLVLCVLAPTAAYAATSAVFILLSRPTSIPHTSAGAPANVIFGIATSLTSIIIEAIVLARLRPALLGQSAKCMTG
jgi:hypothetical protein